MNRDELNTLAHEWISLWNTPVNWGLFDKLHSDDFEDMSPANRNSTKQDFATGMKTFINAFPDLKTNVEDLIVDESTQRVAVRWSAVGTNKHEYLGIGPTNRPTKVTGIEIIEFSYGRVVKRWGEWDISDHQI